jgi:hypothetical protein
MRLIRRLLPGAFLAVIVACGSEAVTTEPGALTITLNGPPPTLTNAGVLQITGQVTRTPAADLPVVVTATGGPNAVSDTATASGAFALSVGLTLNAQNSLSISASDGSGSNVSPVTVSIRHDNQPPQIANMTPAHESDGVTPATVAITFNEPVQSGTASLTVSVQGAVVAGTTELSADSLTLTFAPAAPFPVNAIHAVSTTARDQLGNTLGGASRCFVTGGAGIASFQDPANDIFLTGTPPAGLVPVDFLALRLIRTGGVLRGVIRFDAPRSLDAAANNNVLAVVDFDMDQDGGTGFTTFKDTIFVPAGVLPPSGARAEYTIWIIPQQTPADSSFAAQYTAPLDGPITYLFWPDLCGRLVGFAVPESALGGNVSAFYAVGYADAFPLVGNGGYLDPAPDTDFYVATLPTILPVPSAVPAPLGTSRVSDRVTMLRRARRLP